MVTGRGGLPLNLREAFNNNDTVKVDWVTLKPNSDKGDVHNVAIQSKIAAPESIVEARGWVINKKGEVLLTLLPPNSTPHSSWQILPTCKAPTSNYFFRLEKSGAILVYNCTRCSKERL